MKIKLGVEQARAVQQYQTIASIVGKAFGGESEPEKDKTPQNIEDARSQLSKVLGGG